MSFKFVKEVLCFTLLYVALLTSILLLGVTFIEFMSQYIDYLATWDIF